VTTVTMLATVTVTKVVGVMAMQIGPTHMKCSKRSVETMAAV
jgi:hypothetical protein